MGQAGYRPNRDMQTEWKLWLGVGSTSTNQLQTTVPSIPNARAVGPPTDRSLFLGSRFRPKGNSEGACPLAQLERSYYDPRTAKMALAVH